MREPGRDARGLVTGFAAFAGLPTNPAEQMLAAVDGMVVSGIRIATAVLPVSRNAVPERIADLVDEHRPAFVMSLGLAIGATVVRVETTAVNTARFVIADNDGHRPPRAEPLDPGGPAARRATWDADRLVEALRAEDVPAAMSFHAGTHLCNLTLFTMLGALAAVGSHAPCGFLHLPCLPEQVVWMMRNPPPAERAPVATTEIASMSIELQTKAVQCAVAELARQAKEPRQPGLSRP